MHPLHNVSEAIYRATRELIKVGRSSVGYKGIASKTPNEAVQLGRQANLVAPLVVFADVTTRVKLWNAPISTNPLPPNTTETTILQSIAENISNPIELIVNLDTPVFPFETDRSVDLKANIVWGNGDDKSQAYVDIRTGTQLSLIGSTITISGLYTALTGAPNGFPSIGTGAAFGYGARPSSPPIGPTFTSRMFNTPNAQGEFMGVPRYASTLTVIGQNATTGLSAACRINLQDNETGLTFGTIDQAANVVQTIPLPSLCRTVQIINQSANASNFTLIFGLSL